MTRLTSDILHAILFITQVHNDNFAVIMIIMQATKMSFDNSFSDYLQVDSVLLTALTKLF